MTDAKWSALLFGAVAGLLGAWYAIVHGWKGPVGA